MSNFQRYVVIGAFHTELDTEGTPLLLCDYCTDPQGYSRFVAVRSECFDAHRAEMSACGEEWASHLLASIGNAPIGDDRAMAALLEQLSGLSVGPLRTMASGVFRSALVLDHDESFSVAMEKLAMHVD
jgi:hypothetical protein